MSHPAARTIGADEHVWLAWITWNASDVHGNADRARQGAWGRPLVLGALSAAIVIGLAAPAESGPRQAALVQQGWHEIALGRPVLAGDTLRAVSRIHSVRPLLEEGGGYVERTIDGLSQHNHVVITIRETRFVPVRR